MVLRGVFLRPPRRGVPTPDPDPNGEFEGACPLMRAPPRAAKHHTGVVCEHPSVKAPKAAREQDGSVWKSLVYVTLYIRFPNLATRRAALAGERLRESLLSAVPPPQKEDGQPD